MDRRVIAVVREQLMARQEVLTDSKFSEASSLQALFFALLSLELKGILRFSKGGTEGFYKIKLKKSLKVPFVFPVPPSRDCEIKRAH